MSFFKKRRSNSTPPASVPKNLKIVPKYEVEDEQEQKDVKYTISLSELQAFFKLLDEDDHIYDFLTYDSCCKLADKYLLAMVFTYFKRAGLKRREFNRTNFFIALYLAHDIEEDEDEHKLEIVFWALGHNWRQYLRRFTTMRDKLWKKMNYRAIVSCRLCNEVMAIAPNHHLWERHRPVHHAGAIRAYQRLTDLNEYEELPLDSPPVCRLCMTTEVKCNGDWHKKEE